MDEIQGSKHNNFLIPASELYGILIHMRACIKLLVNNDIKPHGTASQGIESGLKTWAASSS